MVNMTKEEKIYNLIYEKLSPGMEIKNYNKFCELLEISNERGNTKKANLKIIERCCDYEQKGQKFIIKEIYSHPKEKEKKVGNRAIYVPLIEIILLSEFISKDKVTLTFTRRQMMELLGLINENYTKYEFEDNFNFLRELHKIDRRVRQFNIDKAYSDSKSKSLDIIKSALTSLNDRRIIRHMPDVVRARVHDTYFDEIENKNKTVYKYIDVTDEQQLDIIWECENIALEKLGCKNINEIPYNKDKNITWRKFQRIVNKYVYERLGYDYIFRVYKIRCLNKKILQKGLEDNISELRNILNDKFINALICKVEKEYDNKYSKGINKHEYDGFVKIQKIILHKILNIDKNVADKFIKKLCEEEPEPLKRGFGYVKKND